MSSSIIPAILENDPIVFSEKLTVASRLSERIQIDVIDHSFSDSIALPKPDWINEKHAGKRYELHLMVTNPSQYLKPFATAGVDRFILHIETLEKNSKSIYETVSSLGAELFLGIDLPTSLDSLDEYILPEKIDGFTVMTVKAGKSGQSFHENALQKINKLRLLYPDTPIEVDGGINDVTIPMAKQAGATLFGVNSYLFNSIDPEKTYKRLEQLTD